MPVKDSKLGRKSPIVRRLTRVPPAHARALERLAREMSKRQIRLALANIAAQHETTRKELTRHFPDVRVTVPKLRQSPAKPLSGAQRRRIVAEEGMGVKLVRAELRGEVTRLRALLRDSLRAGRRRAQTVGDPTTFLCNFNAQSLTVADDAFTSAGAFTMLTRPVRRELSLARNRTRYLALATAPVGVFRIAPGHHFTDGGCRPSHPHPGLSRHHDG
jgi:hypothetical protein